MPKRKQSNFLDHDEVLRIYKEIGTKNGTTTELRKIYNRPKLSRQSVYYILEKYGLHKRVKQS